MRFRVSLLVLALALVAGACAPDDEIVFDSQSVATSTATTSAAGDTPPTTTPDTPAESTVATTAETTTTSAPPVVESVDLTGTLPGQVLVNLFPSTVRVVDTDGSLAIDVTGDQIFLRQANWAPGGDRVAWAEGDGSAVGSVVIADVATGDRQQIVTPYLPFYLQWQPSGDNLALLGSVPGEVGQQTGLVTVDSATGDVTSHYASSSFYLHWSPDGSSMVTHLNSSLVQIYDVFGQVVEPLSDSLGPFQAAQWAPDGSGVYYIRLGPASAGGGLGLAYQGFQIGEFVFHDLTTNTVDVITEGIGLVTFTISPDGSKAVVQSVDNDRSSRAIIIDLETREEQAFSASLLEFFQWSPDSQHLLMMGIDLETATLDYRVASDGEVTSYAVTQPTALFFDRYLQFWGQYDRSHKLWAPDSSGFVFPARDGPLDFVYFQELGSDIAIRITEGSMASFPPVGP